MSSKHGPSIVNENYPTPKSYSRSLMEIVTPRSTDHFLEPCRGTGSIYDAVNLPEEQKHWAELTKGVDYLKTDFGEQSMDLIITNPPFSLTVEFMEKSFRELKPDGTLIYMQRVNFLGSLKRRGFWKEAGAPDKFITILPRPRFAGKDQDSTEYAWFCYDRGGRINAKEGISWLINEYIEEERREMRELRRLAKTLIE